MGLMLEGSNLIYCKCMVMLEGFPFKKVGWCPIMTPEMIGETSIIVRRFLDVIDGKRSLYSSENSRFALKMNGWKIYFLFKNSPFLRGHSFIFGVGTLGNDQLISCHFGCLTGLCGPFFMHQKHQQPCAGS